MNEKRPTPTNAGPTLGEQATALVTIARGSEDPGAVLALLGAYLVEQPDDAARADLLMALVASLAGQVGTALDLLDAISAARGGQP